MDVGSDQNLQKKFIDKISTNQPMEEKYLVANNSSANLLEYMFPGKCEPDILLDRLDTLSMSSNGELTSLFSRVQNW